MRNRRWLVTASTLALLITLTSRATTDSARGHAIDGAPGAQAASARQATASDAPPNVIVFMIDDAAPHDDRLWSDQNRTPALYNTFVAHGIRFLNAIGEDPLCCPGRAALMTGLHAHNNGVGSNDARFFAPQEELPGALRDVGYTTMWIGKYMNLDNKLSPAGWAAHMAPWSVFDGIFGANGDYYGYRVRTKDHGDIKYSATHSTQMVADRAVMRLAAAPADKPIFAMLSTYDIHGPNTAMPQSRETFAKCDSIAPWWTPNYNEADVSDKPAYIQSLPLLPDPDGWPLLSYCREMFGFDQMVQRVEAELQAEGRLDNTLLIFTADNGMAWGAHRLGQKKSVPYSTPVPLYYAWPARWGTEPRDVSEFVSNIDFAPTVCELAGCTLGPYPTGQAAPDGTSLVGLLDNGTSLNRDALLEQAPVGNEKNSVPGWAGLRTTLSNPLGLWHYVEYEDGERELYDLGTDPYELQNVVGDPGNAALVATLATRLHALLEEGRVSRPDLSAWSTGANLYAGYNLFTDGPSATSTLTQHGKSGTTFKYRVALHNNSLEDDSFTLSASITGAAIATHWTFEGQDVTSAISAGTLVVSNLRGTGTVSLIVQVTLPSPFPRGSSATIQVHAQSNGYPGRTDHLTLLFKR